MSIRPLSLLAACAVAFAMTACVRQVRPDQGFTPALTLEEATPLVPASVPDREGWALDVLTALNENHLPADLEHVCGTLAVIEQESNYQANPPVANLAKIVQRRLEAYSDKLGPLGRPVLEKLLEGRARGSRETFSQRLRKVRTERDLDLIFRDLLRYYEHEFPTTFKLVDLASEVTGRGGLESLNPITTAGSMQVAVTFALEHTNGDVDDWEIRDKLYTRYGGVLYGSARLWGYEAAYDDPAYRFADYNAGLYTSRNAAVQGALETLTGAKLLADGDLLAYDKHGDPVAEDSNSLKALLRFRERYARWISEGDLRDDARTEKTRAFESTDTYRALQEAYRKKTGKPLPYARLPEVTIHSPKLKKDRTTSWFAESVNRRYRACLARYPGSNN